MIFDVNQTEFKSGFQKDIWQRGKSVFPLEVTLVGINDPETREGFTQIYNFTQELLEDMYNNSDKYNEVTKKHHYGVEKFFRIVGGWAQNEFDESGMHVVISENTTKNEGFALLEPFGFVCSDKDGSKILSNKKYPLLFKYMRKFHQMGVKGAARWAYIQQCDFRLFSKVKPQGIDDLLRTLSTQNQKCVKELHDYVISKGAKKESAGYRYKYKSEHIISFPMPSIFISYKLKSGNSLESFFAEINRQADKDKLIAYIKDETSVCNHCGQGNCKAYVEYFICTPHGSVRDRHFTEVDTHKIKVDDIELYRGCSYHTGDVKQSFSDDEISILKRLIDVRFAQIDSI